MAGQGGKIIIVSIDLLKARIRLYIASRRVATNPTTLSPHAYPRKLY